MAFERDVGVDVGTSLDIFSTPDRTREDTEADYKKPLSAPGAPPRSRATSPLAATVHGRV